MVQWVGGGRLVVVGREWNTGRHRPLAGECYGGCGRGDGGGGRTDEPPTHGHRRRQED